MITVKDWGSSASNKEYREQGTIPNLDFDTVIEKSDERKNCRICAEEIVLYRMRLKS